MKTLAIGLLVLLGVLVAESSIAQQGINAPRPQAQPQDHSKPERLC
jgi:hypothetical protein